MMQRVANMKTLPTCPTAILASIISLLYWLALPPAVQATDSGQAKALFKHPPRAYSTGPLWVWNDLLTEQQIRDTLRDLDAQEVKQVWVHPRPGLMTTYLSPDWFRLWKVALREAERLDMNVWIYDENSYPSGFAGGLVPEAMPESRGRGLVFREARTAPKWDDSLLGVYRLGDGTFEIVTATVKAAAPLPEGRYLIAAEARAGNSPWHGNRCYVNLLSPGVTEKFLELTLEPYRREIGREFGRRVPGVFTDEPNIRPAGGLPWSEILVSEFQKRWGYSLLDHLPSLTQPIGDWRKIRHNYFQLLNEQFVEHWGRPYHDYCEKNRLEFTGHYWDHEWPDCVAVPDNMAMYAWHQRPAIDCLMNQYAAHTHAQFGNVRMVKELASVANQLGRPRTLCEAYGAAGWDLRFEDMKRIGDWLEVLGVNTLDQHLSYVTLRGARKRDHPQSFSYHEPWWEAYHVSAEYFARLSAALSQGEQVNRLLVLEPTTTAWMYQGDAARLSELGDSFFKLLMALEAAQIEYDIGSEDIMARHGSVEGKQLKIGCRSYRRVILPAGVENFNRPTRVLLDQVPLALLDAGPARVDGALAAMPARAGRSAGSGDLTERIAGLVAWLRHEQKPDKFRIDRTLGDQGILFHHRRQLADGELLFLVNTSSEFPSAGTIESGLNGVEEWNLYTGKTEPYPFDKSAAGLKANFHLPPAGSLLLFLSKQPLKPAPMPLETVATLAPAGAPAIRRLEPNILTLDYVDVTAGGETKSDIYFYKANQFVWKQNGMDRNPWDSAVQYKDELISKSFTAHSGFEASYKFTIEGPVPTNLAIVIERPDLYTITCNGQPASAKPGDWWLDKSFGRLAIAAAARTGQNVVTIKAARFTMFHELEPAYLLGDFSLEPVAKGFVLKPDRPLGLGSCTNVVTHGNNPDGSMWLSAGIGFDTGAKGKTHDDRAPYVIFDLGRPVDLSAIKVWNYNENHVRDMTMRGASRVSISAAATDNAAAFNSRLGTFTLARASGGQLLPETLPVQAQGVRFVRFDILANHNGVSYPAEGEPADNGFVGLAEVQFVTGAGQTVAGVKVLRASSELKSHQRLARMLVDRSGLSSGRTGWNTAGLPFYGAEVAYRERFDLKSTGGRYAVVLPSWCGSVAKVTINGRLAGFIDAPPYECDVTRYVKRGRNDVEVTVIGTLKNTLGPHHGNPALGAAWPGEFHIGPETGPPPGEHYSTVAYGLFEPFRLKQVTRP